MIGCIAAFIQPMTAKLLRHTRGLLRPSTAAWRRAGFFYFDSDYSTDWSILLSSPFVTHTLHSILWLMHPWGHIPDLPTQMKFFHKFIFSVSRGFFSLTLNLRVHALTAISRRLPWLVTLRSAVSISQTLAYLERPMHIGTPTSEKINSWKNYYSSTRLGHTVLIFNIIIII